MPRRDMLAHLDVDCFFAQVEEVRLSLNGRPLGVQQNMEIAAVNYEARAFGLYNRISVVEGQRLCPELVLVRGDNGINGMQRYRLAGQAVLRCIMQALDEHGLPANWVGRPVEHASFDDFFVQLPGHLATAEAASKWAEKLRAAVLQATGLRCSIGLARTKLLSVLATKRAKPNGMYCCIGAASERELLDAAGINSIRGAGLLGLRPSTRDALRHALGEASTLGDARAWLQRDASAVAAALAAAEVEALGALLNSACDGSTAGAFSLPRGLSVECSVRPTEYEPATSLEHLAYGYAQLAPLLLSRAEDDAATYGHRRPAHLVVKWKLFPSAKEVRQAQVAWPHAADARAISALATRTFGNAVGRQPFRVSRAVLALIYHAGSGNTAASTAPKRKRAALGQSSLLGFLKGAANAAPCSPGTAASTLPMPASHLSGESSAVNLAQQCTAEGSSCAPCPICGASTSLLAMNEHLDSCLLQQGSLSMASCPKHMQASAPLSDDDCSVAHVPSGSNSDDECSVVHVALGGNLQQHPNNFLEQMNKLSSSRASLEAEWHRLTKHALPSLAAAQGWPLREDHCFMRVALDAAFDGCWYDHLDRKKGSAISQIATAELSRAVTAAQRMETQGISAVRELNEASLQWRGKSKAKDEVLKPQRN